jgi:hypothetical protein
MSRRNSAVNSQAAAQEKPLPDVIELEESEKISLFVLTEKLTPLLASRAKIVAKIEAANNLTPGTIGVSYQFDGERLFRPTI